MSLKTRLEALATRIAAEFKALRASKLDASAINVTLVNNMTGSLSLPYTKDLIIYGDENTFYPVQIIWGNQDAIRTIKISRSYHEQAPWDPIGTGAHHGGLMLTWQGNFGGWGGATYFDRLEEFTESYTNIVGDMGLSTHCMGYTFFLRGGGTTGAIYYFASSQGLNGYNSDGPLVGYNTSVKFYDHVNPAYIVYAPAAIPLGSQNTARIDGLLRKKQSDLQTTFDARYDARYLPLHGKADDANLLDGIDSSRIVYGDGAGKSTGLSDMNGQANQPSGFYFAHQPNGMPIADYIHWISCMGNSWMGANYGFQIAHQFHGGGFYVRLVANGGYQAWRTIWDSDSFNPALKANLNSPAFTGIPTVPTPATSDDSTTIANTAFVKAVVAALVDSSPAALDTLNELAAALGDDPNFATTITNALAGKMPIGGIIGAVAFGRVYSQANGQSIDWQTASLFTQSFDGGMTGIAFHISGIKGSMLHMNADTKLYWENQLIYHSGNFDPATKAAADHGDHGLATHKSKSDDHPRDTRNQVAGSYANADHGDHGLAAHKLTSTDHPRDTRNQVAGSYADANHGDHGLATHKSSSTDHPRDERSAAADHGDHGMANALSEKLGNNGPQMIGGIGHADNANTHSLELRADYGTENREISLRFHQANRWYHQIRNNGSGFRFTVGHDGGYVNIYAADIFANGNRVWDGGNFNPATKAAADHGDHGLATHKSKSDDHPRDERNQVAGSYAAADHGDHGLANALSGKLGVNAKAASASSADLLLINNSANQGNALQFMQFSEQNAAGDLPASSWYHVIKMMHGEGDTYYNRALAFDFFSNDIYTRKRAGGTATSWVRLWDAGNFDPATKAAADHGDHGLEVHKSKSDDHPRDTRNQVAGSYSNADHGDHGMATHKSSSTDHPRDTRNQVAGSYADANHGDHGLGAHAGNSQAHPRDERNQVAGSYAAAVHGHSIIEDITDEHRLFNNMGQDHSANGDFNSVDFGARFLQGTTNGPGIPLASQYYGLYLGLGNDYGSNLYGSQLYWPRGESANPYLSIRFRENGAWSGWRKIFAGYADNAGNADNANLLDGLDSSVFARKQDGSRYSTDWNTILSSGFYNGEGTPANSPVSYGQLIVAKGVDTGLQIAGGYDNNELHFRGWGYGPNNGFHPWRRLWHDGNFDPASKADASIIVNQTAHGFAVGNAVGLSGSIWIKAKADSVANAVTLGLVSQVIDANNFRYVKGGILAGSYTAGAAYYLSTSVAGGLMTLANPEVWVSGQVRQYIGTGTKNGDGLDIEIDLGDEVSFTAIRNDYVTNIAFNENTRVLTLTRTGDLAPLTIAIPYPDSDIAFEARDVQKGVAQVYELDMKASWPYTILSVVLASNGTLNNVTVKINSTAVGGLTNLAVGAITETNATSANTVAAGDVVTINTTTSYSGNPTLIRVKLKIKRTA